MSKKIFYCNAKPPDIPKVRFMRKSAGSGPAFTDVTVSISRIALELVNGESGPCALVRMGADGGEVWRTLHQSQDEARVQARYEYGVMEQDWEAANGS
jgi:hypothetical protein